MLIALNLLYFVWLIVTWIKGGFLAALNLFAFGLLVAVIIVMHVRAGDLPLV